MVAALAHRDVDAQRARGRRVGGERERGAGALGHSGVTKGKSAAFTLSADSAPSAHHLDVTVTATQYGDYGAATGTLTVPVPTAGSYTLSVATNNDSTDEPDGSITVTVDPAASYTVSATAGSASVAVADDDGTADPGFAVEDTADAEADKVRFRVTLTANTSTTAVRAWWKAVYAGWWRTLHGGESGDSRYWAMPNRDYNKASGWLTFEPGTTEQWAEVIVPDDAIDEPDEPFLVLLAFVDPHRGGPPSPTA